MESTNFWDVGLVTRSGRVVPPSNLPNDKEKTHAEIIEEDNEVIKQLKRTQSNVSVWGLLASSTAHRDALVKALTQIPVPTSASPDEVVHLLTADRSTVLSFSDADLTLEGLNHNRPLMIIVGCASRRIPSVLVDNGSALNVCPLVTAVALGFGKADFGESSQVVRAYDNTSRKVIGTLELGIQLGPVTFPTLFQVLEVRPSFNLLLGRPFIHAWNVLPSSLHQKLRYRHEKDIITIDVVPDPFPLDELILEIKHSDSDPLLSGFHFKQVHTVELSNPMRDYLPLALNSHSNLVISEILWDMRFMPSLGLGRHQQGVLRFVEDIEPNPIFGLGHVPKEEDWARVSAIHRGRSLARCLGIPFDYSMALI